MKTMMNLIMMIVVQKRSKSPKKKPSTGKTIRCQDRVDAKATRWTKYYGGEVTRVNDDKTYDIKFEYGECKRGVKQSQIKGGKDQHDDESDFDDLIMTIVVQNRVNHQKRYHLQVKKYAMEIV